MGYLGQDIQGGGDVWEDALDQAMRMSVGEQVNGQLCGCIAGLFFGLGRSGECRRRGATEAWVSG